MNKITFLRKITILDNYSEFH